MGIFQDWDANKNNPKGRLVMILYRFAFLIKSKKVLFILLFIYLIFYRFFVEWVLSIEIPWNVRIGSKTKLYHGQGTVIHPETIIGDNCTIRQNTTIGNKNNGASPVLGNNVDIGANVCIIGEIEIGNNVTIGAGSVVVKSIPSNCVVAGNPARIIKQS
jgi:putative colanic acid biosynthesis acetyltransferase WcaB